MEAFTLLKYWRGGGGAVSLPSPSPPPPPSLLPARHNTTTIVASAFPDDNAAPPPSTDEDSSAAGDDGPFFDLEFAVGEVGDDDDEEEEEGQRKGDDSSADSDSDGGGDGDEGEFDFTLSSASSCNDRADPTGQLALSPSDEMFFKGTLLPMMESSDAMNPKSQRIPVSLLKSATKFRVFLLGFKKSNKEKIPGEQKSADSAGDGDTAAALEQKEEEGKGNGNGRQGKLFTVKFKVEEVPIVSLFTRDNSSKSGNKSSLQQKEQSGGVSDNPGDATSAAAEERQRFSKEALQKYLKKVKPLYVRVSKRYGEKLGFSGQLSLGSNMAKSSATTAEAVGVTPPVPAILKASPSKSSSSSSEKVQQEAGTVNCVGQQNVKGAAKQGNLQAGLRVMCKHLGKSRSASSAVAAAPPPPTAAASNRRDDSLLQQQDGIQSAILHCKRSFNASRDSQYSRSASESSSSPEKPGESSGKDSGGDDGKASSGPVV
ncbi:unnamed protein product [Linum tenue]|uniref:Membrane-associated kinase regulator 2 n=1 Tax=Linum tenue TaxID=586396 RepID=A0AAV0K4W4_9ROSI|nr:unnamed protein product [Linum tenue]